MSFRDDLGVLNFASRLKSLADLIYHDEEQLYKGYEFQPRWFTTFYLLKAEGAMSITEIASALDTSHPAIIQISKDMVKAGLVVSDRDKNDARKRLLTLTEKGEALFKELEPVWAEQIYAMEQIFESLGVDLPAALAGFTRIFKEKSVATRVQERLTEEESERVEVVPYHEDYRDYFRRFNEEWLMEWFEIEDSDREILGNPEKYVLDSGGQIFFALVDGEVIGTCALVSHGDGVFELAKMGVTKAWRHKRAGSCLTQAVIDYAKNLKAKTLFLQTNPNLRVANHVYRKFGFIQARSPLGSLPRYRRPTLVFEKDLT